MKLIKYNHIYNCSRCRALTQFKSNLGIGLDWCCIDEAMMNSLLRYERTSTKVLCNFLRKDYIDHLVAELVAFNNAVNGSNQHNPK